MAYQPNWKMQISGICQAAQHGTGYLAQPGLEGRAVTHPGGNMARDGHGNRIGCLVGVCSSKRFHGLDKGCQRRKWNAWLSVRARHSWIDMGNSDRNVGPELGKEIRNRPKAAQPVRVGWGDGEKRGVDRKSVVWGKSGSERVEH